jgi:3-hydroxyacyl-[acyl-carrier-protein] dehydratase
LSSGFENTRRRRRRSSVDAGSDGRDSQGAGKKKAGNLILLHDVKYQRVVAIASRMRTSTSYCRSFRLGTGKGFLGILLSWSALHCESSSAVPFIGVERVRDNEPDEETNIGPQGNSLIRLQTLLLSSSWYPNMSENRRNQGTDEISENLAGLLRRCSEETTEAVNAFLRDRDPKLAEPVVFGVIERFLEPEHKETLKKRIDSTRLIEDLGVDSMVMIEMVILFEDLFEIAIANEEITTVETVGDLNAFLQKKIDENTSVDGEEGSILDTDEIRAKLPMSPPFLFLDSAHLWQAEASGEFALDSEAVYFRAHCPEHPVFPASLIIEALGQLAILHLLHRCGDAGEAALNPSGLRFTSCEGVRCRRECLPGETLQLKVVQTVSRHPVYIYRGSVKVGGEGAASVESITFAARA